jgi:hypothetical protein
MTLVIDTAIPGGQFQKQVTSLVPLDQWKISADLQLMVRSKVRGGGDKSTSSLLTPDPAFSVAMLQAEGPRDVVSSSIVQCSLTTNPILHSQPYQKWTTTRARECVLRSLTPTTLLPSNASATCRGSPTPQPDQTVLHHSLRLLLFNPFTRFRLDLRHTPR